MRLIEAGPEIGLGYRRMIGLSGLFAISERSNITA